MAAAIERFARKGFYGTTTHEIAEEAGISQPYLYRLFPNKEAMFAAAVDRVSEVMTATLAAHAANSVESKAVPLAARDAYTALISDETVLRFLMHANCAAEEPLVREAVRRCYAKQVHTVERLLGSDDEAVRRWFGAGMLENVVNVLGLADIDEPWADVLASR